MNDMNRRKIEQRAYELFVKRGGVHGYHMEDWLRAEREISALATLRVMPVEAVVPKPAVAPKKKAAEKTGAKTKPALAKRSTIASRTSRSKKSDEAR